MVGTTEDEIGIEEVNGLKYRVVNRTTTFDDPPDINGKSKPPIVVELSRTLITSNEDKIVELEAKNDILEAAKIDFEARITELEAKVATLEAK